MTGMRRDTPAVLYVFEMHEGRILRQREYLDRDSALEAAGLTLS
jgi:hypothetical protein